MPVNSVLVFYRPKEFEFGHYRCEAPEEVKHGNEATRGGCRGPCDEVRMVQSPLLSVGIEDGFKHIEKLDFFLPGDETRGCVTKHDEVSTDFCEKVKTRLENGGQCPVTSGHVRIPFGLTITGRIPAGGVVLGARPLGINADVLECHLLHMPVGLFMEYLDDNRGLPVVQYLGPKFETNEWLTENVEIDYYTLRDWTHESRIIPDGGDVNELVEQAQRLVLDTRDSRGAEPDDTDEVKVAVQCGVKTKFEAGTDYSRYTTASASGVLFPHVDGYDIAAIIPVTLQVQVQVGSCDICSNACTHLTVLCANKHEMCVDCVATWIQKNGDSCPFCRSPLLDSACSDAAAHSKTAMHVSGAIGRQGPFDLRKTGSNIYIVPL